MSTVVKQVTAEVRAKGEQFEAEMAKIEARAKRTKASIEGVAGASDFSSQKFANATRQIAGSIETMERTGKVAGEAAKGFIAAGSNIAFAFGPTGAAVGALSIFALAVGRHLGRAREEARKTAEEFELAVARMQNAGDVGGLLGEARTLWMGTRAKDFEDGIMRRQQRLAQMRADLEDPTKTNPFNVLTRLKAIKDEEAALDPLITKFEKLREVIRGFREDPLRKSGADEITITGVDPKAEERAATAGEKAGAAFAAAFEKAMLDALGSAGARAGAEIDALIQQGMKVGADPEQIAQLERTKEQAVTAAEGVDRLKDAWRDYKSGTTTGGSGDPILAGANALLALKAAIDDADSRLLFLTEDTAAYNQLQEERNALQERYNNLLRGEKEAKPEKLPNAMKETALHIQQAADGALQLAQNLFGAEAGAIGTLRAVAQIAGNIGRISELQAAGKLTGLSAAGPILAILGAVSSLFSNPEHAKRMRENTEALRVLGDELGLLGSRIGGSGADLVTGREGAGRVIEEFARRRARFGPGMLEPEEMRALNTREIARDLGLSFRELQQIASDYGIELDGSIRSFEQLQAALDDASLKLGEFGTDLDSQRRQAAARARVFGIDDPAALLGLTRDTYAGRSPALDKALEGLDLSTAEGRAAARKALQDLYLLMEAGGGVLTPEQLGMGGDDFLQAILDLIESMNAVDESLDSNGVTAEKGDRVIRASETQITADQASRLVGLNTSMEAHLRVMRSIMEAARLPIPIPQLPPGWSQPMAAGGITVNISQEFYGQTSPRDVARATTDALVEAIDRGLGRRILIQKRHVGDAVSS